MNKPYFVFLWTVTIVVSGTMLFIGISLIPHFGEIGYVATIVVFIFLGYGTIGVGGYLFLKLYQMWVYRNVITSGDVVAYKVGNDFKHLSAEHERAKVPLMLPGPKEEVEPETPEADILLMYKKGMHLRDIATLTGSTYYRVQKICAGQ